MPGRSDLKGSTALVTGAGAGIGAGIARELGRQGATVVVNDLNPSAADALAAELSEAGHTSHVAPGDVARDDDVASMVDVALARTGRLDIVVNNAGIGHAPTPFESLDPDDALRRWQVNVAGPLRCTRAASAALRTSPAGRVVNIGSRSWLGARGFADYGSTKGAVVSLTRTLAIELGDDDVTVNAVIPGSIVTPAFDALPDDARADILARHPAGRFGTPADIGRAVAFFCSPAAGALTGQLLHVCGGRSLYGGPT